MTTGNDSGGGTVSGTWEDIPVPKGFRPVNDPSLAIPITAGAYRAGEFLYRGRSTSEKIREYYQDRMPQFGWDWDQSTEVWVKEGTELQIDIRKDSITGYEDLPESLELLLQVRSQRLPTQG